MWDALSKDNRIVIFYGGLLLLLILLAAFFLLENTPIHRNRLAERTYLSIVVMFAFGWIMTTTVLLSDLTGEPSEEVSCVPHPRSLCVRVFAMCACVQNVCVCSQCVCVFTMCVCSCSHCVCAPHSILQ